ncbi:MAG: protein kinase, partial [Faecousia sp.]
MSEQSAVSPLLDGFTIGSPVNDHFGVCCFPAVKENSERKYIVKVISVPASQTQLDALLITGAYQDSAEAADYFRQLSDSLLQEAQLLQTLSRLEGFLPYEGCQVEPMQKNRIGYQVYLLSGFRLSLERYMHRHTVSHLEAVNLGIDLCGALAACRRAGMLYIDLKPSNIFISSKKEYKIGDLGFTPLDSMKFSPMPEKYRSCYTPPELLDDLSVLNGTVDTYALGMILYQIFNNGVLPQDLTKPLPAPAAADEEMAGILLKACAPDPA